MKYITGIHALNLPCQLDTVGDWHQSAIQWKHPQMRESTESVFGYHFSKTYAQQALAHKGAEYFDYLTTVQHDAQIDPQKLKADFLEAMKKLCICVQ